MLWPGGSVRGFFSLFLGLFVLLAAAPHPAQALDTVDFRLVAGSPALEADLRAASLVLAAKRDKRTDAQDVYAAARSDYGRLLGALYAAGHYSGVISIRIDGREAAQIGALAAPARISQVQIEVQPGPVFTLGRADIGPLAAQTKLPEGFASGQVARSAVLRSAVEAATDRWREAGHAKVSVQDQSLVADHPKARLDAQIRLQPGPLVRLGSLRFAGETGVRPARLAEIAGFRSGRVYSPAELRKVADRLRRTGVFQTVALAEADRLGPGDTLDVTATLADLPLRRIGGGVEFASDDGLTISGYWMHRNLFGGAERFRVEGGVARIGGRPLGFSLGATFDRPATFTPDTNLTLSAKAERLKYGVVSLDTLNLGAGLTHVFSDTLSGSLGLEYAYSRLNLPRGPLDFQHLSLPISLKWDRRDNRLDPKAGTYLEAHLRPFLGFDTTGTGAQVKLDGRIYRALGERLVLAARVQGGAVVGTTLEQTPAQYRFYSGGGGTVRGHPFQSLGVTSLGGDSGGNLFLGASIEARVKITETIGAVAFYDIGLIEELAAPLGDNWHGGIGLGLRYATGVGAIRLDVGLPLGGKPGNGPQIYLGIGQAF